MFDERKQSLLEHFDSPKESLPDQEQKDVVEDPVDFKIQILDKLKTSGILTETQFNGEKVVVFSKDRFNQLFEKPNLQIGRTKFSRWDLIQSLSGVFAVDESDFEIAQSNSDHKLTAKPLVYIPENIQSVKNFQNEETIAHLRLSDFYKLETSVPKLKLELHDGSKVNLSKLFVMSDLGSKYIRYDFTQPESVNAEFGLNARHLHKLGIIDFDKRNQGVVLDTKKLQSYLRADGNHSSVKTRLRQNIFFLFKNIRGYTKDDTDRSSERLEKKEFIPVPVDLNEMFSLNYLKRVEQAVFNPWDLMPSYGNAWVKHLRLESGEVTNLAEVTIAALAKKMKFHRKDGVLFYVDVESGEKKKFSVRKFLRDAGLPAFSGKVLNRNASGGNTGAKHNIAYEPRMFLHRFLSHLLERGVLTDADFKTNVGSEAHQSLGIEVKRINPNTNYIGISSPGGKSVRYYLGKNKLVGLNIPLKNLGVGQLDPNTSGIYKETSQGNWELIASFPLLSKESSIAITEETMKRRGEAFIPADVVVPANYTEKNLKTYSVSDYVPRRADETVEEYVGRMDNLKDSNSVVNSLEEILGSKAMVSRMKWSEQLILAGLLKENDDKEKIVNFANTFGLEGLKVLTTADYQRSLFKDILELAESKPEYFRKISKEYSKFVDNAGELMGLIDTDVVYGELGDKQFADKFPKELNEALLRRAKDLVLATELTQREDEQEKHVGVMRAINLMSNILKEFFSGTSEFTFGEVGRNNEAVILPVINKNNQEEYNLKIFIREEASKAGQARINFELSFDTDHPDVELAGLFSQTVQYSDSGKQKSISVFRVGIDLEDAGDQQLLSLDLGRSAYSGEKLVRSGDALGNLLQQVSESGSHTQDSFSGDYEKHFSGLAKMFKVAVESRLAELRS